MVFMHQIYMLYHAKTLHRKTGGWYWTDDDGLCGSSTRPATCTPLSLETQPKSPRPSSPTARRLAFFKRLVVAPPTSPSATGPSYRLNNPWPTSRPVLAIASSRAYQIFSLSKAFCSFLSSSCNSISSTPVGKSYSTRAPANSRQSNSMRGTVPYVKAWNLL